MKERVDSLDRKKLTHLISLSAESPVAWTDAELAQMLSLQLQARIEEDYHAIRQESRGGEPASGPPPAGEVGTFLELLQSSNPSGELLRWAKGYFKHLSGSKTPLLPEPVCRALYYAVVAVATRHQVEGISKMSADDLSHGVKWLLSKSWLDPRLRAILKREEQGQ